MPVCLVGCGLLSAVLALPGVCVLYIQAPGHAFSIIENPSRLSNAFAVPVQEKRWSCELPSSNMHPPWPSPPPHALEEETAQHRGSNGDAAHDGRSQKPLLGHLVVDQALEAGRLEVTRLLLQQSVVVSPCLAVVAQLVVSERQKVRAFAAPLV